MRRACGAHPAPAERITLCSTLQLYPQPITRPSPPLAAVSQCLHDFEGGMKAVLMPPSCRLHAAFMPRQPAGFQRPVS